MNVCSVWLSLSCAVLCLCSLRAQSVAVYDTVGCGNSDINADLHLPNEVFSSYLSNNYCNQYAGTSFTISCSQTNVQTFFNFNSYGTADCSGVIVDGITVNGVAGAPGSCEPAQRIHNGAPRIQAYVKVVCPAVSADDTPASIVAACVLASLVGWGAAAYCLYYYCLQQGQDKFATAERHNGGMAATAASGTY